MPDKPVVRNPVTHSVPGNGFPFAARYDIRMSDYRRYDVPGGTYFLTVVTDRRAPLFCRGAARQLLGSAMRRSVVTIVW